MALDTILLSYAFAVGMAAFLNPCSFALISAYLSHYIGKEGTEKRAAKGLKVGVLAGLGFLSVLLVLGGIILLAGRWLLSYIPLLSGVMGLVLIMFGALMFMGKSIPFPSLAFLHRSEEGKGSFIAYGAGYALSSLGCTFPLFLTVASMAITASDALNGILTFASYSAGTSLLMVLTSIGVIFSKDLVQKRMVGAIPLIRKLSSLVIVLAGLYLIYYKSGLQLFLNL